MTVKELIEALGTLDPDLPVFVDSDLGFLPVVELETMGSNGFTLPKEKFVNVVLGAPVT